MESNDGKYKPDEFIKSVLSKMPKQEVPTCRFCGGKSFTSTKTFMAIPIGDDFTALNLGPSIPSGMLICENCGHIELFSLGVLGQLPARKKLEGKKNA